jgi:hypothetical protein
VRYATQVMEGLRPEREDGFRTAQAVAVDDAGQIDTAGPARRARSPEQASTLLRRERIVHV